MTASYFLGRELGMKIKEGRHPCCEPVQWVPQPWWNQVVLHGILFSSEHMPKQSYLVEYAFNPQPYLSYVTLSSFHCPQDSGAWSTMLASQPFLSMSGWTNKILQKSWMWTCWAWSRWLWTCCPQWGRQGAVWSTSPASWVASLSLVVVTASPSMV